MALVLIAIMGPLVLMYALIASDMRSDLSSLKTRPAPSPDLPTLVGWHDLRPPAGRARMLGYMMDGYQPVPDGTQVSSFTLMPEAGQIGHPAHRIPDEMVDVRLNGQHAVRYADRSLVWVTGTLAALERVPHKNTPAWSMTIAEVAPATQADIARWSAER